MRSEEGDVRDARCVDGGVEVGRRISGEAQRVARAGRRGYRDSPLRVQDGAVSCHQGRRRLRQLEEVLLVHCVHIEDDELHFGVGVCASHRLRHPLVGAIRRGEGAAPLVGSGALASALQGDRCGTNGRSVIAVNRERVVGLVLSTRALFFHTTMGAGGAGLGQRGRHQERAQHFRFLPIGRRPTGRRSLGTKCASLVHAVTRNCRGCINCRGISFRDVLFKNTQPRAARARHCLRNWLAGRTKHTAMTSITQSMGRINILR